MALFVVDTQFRSLQDDLGKSHIAAFAAGTRHNLWCQWKAYIMFCLYFSLKWLPASEHVVALFAQFLSRSFRSADSVQSYVSGTKLLHIILNQSCAAFDNLGLKLAIRGIRRSIRHAPKQALPITVEMLVHMYQVMDMANVNHVVFWSLFTLAFFTMSRKSNLVVTNHTLPVKCLRKADICVTEGYNMLLVVFRWSKTNQFGSRVHTVPLLPISGSPLCPVKAYIHMRSLVKVSDCSPAFCMVKNGCITPVTYYELHKFLRDTLSKLGYNSDLYSSHSFRRGAATLAFRRGVHPSLIKAIGDWSSDAYKEYIHLDLIDKMVAIRKMFVYQ